MTQFMTQAGKSEGKTRAFSGLVDDLQEQLFRVTAKAEVTRFPSPEWLMGHRELCAGTMGGFAWLFSQSFPGCS